MRKLRVLVLGPHCNPDTVSIAFVTYQHAAALARLHEVTLVAGSSVEEKLRRAGAPFRGLEIVRTPLLDRLHEWCLRRIFKSNYDSQVLTAFQYPFAVAFEWYAWQQLRSRIRAGDFDVVLRLEPLTAVLPSPFALFLRNGPIPFVIGPLNGGLPWPPGFSQLERQRQWISGLRNLYRFLPFARSTYRNAAAIIVASSQTYAEFAEHKDKMFFVPENGIDKALCGGERHNPHGREMLELVFVGGLVPRKACDLALRGSASLLRSKRAHFAIIGDGPERGRLEQLVASLNIESFVSFCGWMDHADVLAKLRSADIFVFPSLRDFGGGVVFEALASGAVPIVVDFGGPGDIVTSDVGYKVALTSESGIALQIEKALAELAASHELLARLRMNGMTYARERLTWDAKAESTTSILEWVLHKGSKPDLLPPKLLQSVSSREAHSVLLSATSKQADS